MQSMLSILPIALLASTTAGFLLPNPSGKYNVTLTTGSLTDYTRNDPYAATPTPRELMLSVFQPATCASSTVPAPYMPNQTAEYQGPFLESIFNISTDFTPIFLEAQLPVCSDNCSVLDGGNSPILLFSPGYSIPRLYYNVLASSIASQGFTVITIDHPGDANIIVYPDGHAVYNTNVTVQTTEAFQSHLPIRAVDASFVVDQLSNATAIASLLPQRGARPFPTDRVAMLGHSLGGVAAVLAAGQDSRLRGAINWDGTFVLPPPSSGVSQPTLLISHGFADDSWTAAWPLLTGPKLWVNVANATHETFSDAPSLLQAAGQNATAFAGILGTVAPAETVQILTAYTTTWMNGVFAGEEGGPLLQGQEPDRFPEISVVLKDNF